ncbi:MAG: hypothetical protein JKY96_02300 [Phycisphaerales bacterium]|nr:hypothetical protein [Phycisphaerales bacterium]
MNKMEWVESLYVEIERLKSDSWERQQEDMIDAFCDQEMQRMLCFDDNELVGYKEELPELFNRYQSHYAYEKQIHFTHMGIFSEQSRD